jgi:hypothetical protein
MSTPHMLNSPPPHRGPGVSATRPTQGRSICAGHKAPDIPAPCCQAYTYKNGQPIHPPHNCHAHTHTHTHTPVHLRAPATAQVSAPPVLCCPAEAAASAHRQESDNPHRQSPATPGPTRPTPAACSYRQPDRHCTVSAWSSARASIAPGQQADMKVYMVRPKP